MYTELSFHFSRESNTKKRESHLGLPTRMQRSFNTVHKIKLLLLPLFGFLLRKALSSKNQSFGTLTSQFACGSKQDSVYTFLVSFQSE